MDLFLIVDCIECSVYDLVQVHTALLVSPKNLFSYVFPGSEVRFKAEKMP